MGRIGEVIQSPLFAKQKKKLNRKHLKNLDEAIQLIMKNPEIGSSKSGDLQGIRVYKFKLDSNLILIAYENVGTRLYLYTFGSHENFYRKLSRYIHR